LTFLKLIDLNLMLYVCLRNVMWLEVLMFFEFDQKISNLRVVVG